MNTVQKTLEEICSLLQYMIDRGELEHIQNTIDKVRWMREPPLLDTLDIVIDNQVVRLTAEVIGDHVHEYDTDGWCDGCRSYNEEFDHPEEAGNQGVMVNVVNMADLIENLKTQNAD